MTTVPSPAERRRRLGRRLGIAVFALLIGGFTVICSIQIIQQVWFPQLGPGGPDCSTGTRRLVLALERARRAAAAESGNESAALARFRSQLAPEWNDRALIERACSSDPGSRRALEDLVELRYAEEHAVRFEAVGLAGLRRKVQELFPSAPDLPPTP